MSEGLDVCWPKPNIAAVTGPANISTDPSPSPTGFLLCPLVSLPFGSAHWQQDLYAWALAQSADYIAQLDRQRRERTGLVADVILAEVAAFDKYSSYTEDQLQTKQSNLNKELSGETDPAVPAAVRTI